MENMRRMLNEAYLPLHTQARALEDALTGWHGHRPPTNITPLRTRPRMDSFRWMSTPSR